MIEPNEPGKPAPYKNLSAVVEALIGASPNPALLRELYYLSLEPGFLPVIRAVAALPEAARSALESFVRNAPDASAIVAQFESDPCLRLGYSTQSPPGE
jgi:hypothetical protein